ncbi:DNA primase [Chryseotalea sanaruensis]|uniref:DNA primase n=1 Tax=Chryseotalea sanaruensis TaxID=2482724 RepID=A0A401UDL4_9BACT|nr:DNA primase [Chryseotalea sanaruensis]GCC52974.1 DNA primase [Chryseotalea sanaruensis]
MITRETIDDIKNRMDIVDVISDFITLKRSGQNYKALSPFNNEKTPSFYVVPAKGIFKDFSSGKGGDAITFVMEHEGMSYTEALRYLAKKYGIELKETVAAQEELEALSARDSLYIVMNFAKEHFKGLLKEHEEGKSIGLSYFHERGFNDRTIEKFELGYALNEWHNLEETALAKGYSAEVLEKSGLVIFKEDQKHYDRFRGRVIFPVHNLAGKIIAFGARILTKEKDQPKYINSPETEIYHKSNVLYGMYQAKNAIRKEDFCFLVEGYTDVISMHQAGIENAVASSGTALTEEQIKLIRRFTENITVLFDGDAAGIKAALRGIDLVLKGGLNVRVLLLPDGDDPDSFSKKRSSTELKTYFQENTKDFISFKIDLYAADASRDPIKKAEAIREIITSISVIPDPIKRSVYIQETSSLLKIQESVLLTELNKILIGERKKQQEKVKDEPEVAPDFSEEFQENTKLDTGGMVQMQERETIRLLLNYAESAVEEQKLIHYLLHEMDEVVFTNPVFGEIFQTFKTLSNEGKAVDEFYFLENGSTEVKKIVADLMTSRYHTSPHWSEKYHIFFPHEKEVIGDVAYSNVLRFKFRAVQKLMEDNLQKIKLATSDADLDKFLTIHEQLKNAEREIAETLGIVIAK